MSPTLLTGLREALLHCVSGQALRLNSAEAQFSNVCLDLLQRLSRLIFVKCSEQSWRTADGTSIAVNIIVTIIIHPSTILPHHQPWALRMGVSL